MNERPRILTAQVLSYEDLILNSPILTSHDGEYVSPQLPQLLVSLYEEVVDVPGNLSRLRASLERLLVFLCSTEGRTHANCVETDRFILNHFDWPVSWDHLPKSYRDVLEDIGGTLHDSIRAPDVAENFESTPEQLLVRVRSLSVARNLPV